MTAQNPGEPIGPLTEALIAHLTSKIGPPISHFIVVSGGRDIHATGWMIGHGEIHASLGGIEEKGTDVEIVILASGSLVTSRRSWTRGMTENSMDGSGRVNPTIQAAYDWLLNDGDGRLGRASKEAWTQACRSFPPMSDLEYEVVK